MKALVLVKQGTPVAGNVGIVAKLGETLLNALVAGKTVDPTPILKVYEDS